MKKILSMFSIIVLSFLLVGCKKDSSKTIKVGVAFYPMDAILKLIQEDVKKDGYDLVISDISDYQANNHYVNNGNLDANMIQHQYFLNIFNQANQTNLVIAQPIYHATFVLYSKTYQKVEDIPHKAMITVPEDPANLSRTLYLLHQAKIITLKDGKYLNATLEDIKDNPKEIVFDLIHQDTLAHKYKETGLAVMYPKDALSLNLSGNQEQLFVEKADDVTNGFAISLATKDSLLNSDKIQVLIKHLTSQKVKDFLNTEYGWASRPAF